MGIVSSVRLLVLDVDGTVLTSEHSVAPARGGGGELPDGGHERDRGVQLLEEVEHVSERRADVPVRMEGAV